MTKPCMEVIHSWYEGTNDEVGHDRVKTDWPKLKRLNEKALKNDPTWSMFGGVLQIENRKYQVVCY